LILRLFNVAGEGPLGFTPRVAEGWESVFSARPTPDAPSLDESIAAGYGFVIDRACGTFLPGDTRPVVGYWHGNIPMTCDMRGPGAFGAFAKVGGLTAWEVACRVRTDECRRRGLEAAIYIGMPSAEAWNPDADSTTKRRVLNAWVDPIQRAGFTRVMLDAAANAAGPNAGPHFPAMEFAEECLYRGIAVDHEGATTVTPVVFPWHNGRFGSVMSPADREKSCAPGYFGPACVGCVTKRWLWLQGGGAHAGWKTMHLKSETAGGGNVIVDFGGMDLVKL
jgi:hypothetical protein